MTWLDDLLHRKDSEEPKTPEPPKGNPSPTEVTLAAIARARARLEKQLAEWKRLQKPPRGGGAGRAALGEALVAASLAILLFVVLHLAVVGPATPPPEAEGVADGR